MRLKRLELTGFKSFADRTTMEFDHRLVGIVGPNGCGKSNVVDAVRWVLGEQRPTSMRGDEMVDVIFKGSASRPAMSMAEVTITLKNEGELEDRGEEVAVTRRVYKDGEGEYLIDGQRMRLKDVREMLFGTGLGSRGYSVLEQGKIDAVLSANPVDRRAIFEEAAGISRFRQRRKEIESRLRRVQSDLDRLEDIVRELEKRERSLKIQAGRAQRFVEAKEKWCIDGLRLARHQACKLDLELSTASAVLQGLEADTEDLRATRQAAEARVTESEKGQEELLGEVDRLTTEVSELAGEVRALDERRLQLIQRVRAWRTTDEDETRRAAELETRLAERKEELARLDAEHARLEAEATRAREVHEQRSRTLSELFEAHRNVRTESEEANVRVLEELDRRTSAKNRVQHLEQNLEPLDERSRRAHERCDRARADLELAQGEEEATRKALGELEERIVALQAEREATEKNASELDERRLELESRRSALELESARKASRVEALLDREAEREGLEEGARGLIQGLETGAGPTLSNELAGLLADHLEVPTEHARAMDAVLGERAEALVVDNPDDAAAIVRWLKERQLGRVDLVVRTGLAHPGAPATGSGWPEGLEGVQGRLADRVQAAPFCRQVVDYLLAGVYLVRDVPHALELASEHPELRFVTAEGDLVDRAGVHGGHLSVAQGPVGRRSVAAELDRERETIDSNLALLVDELAGVHAEHSDVHERLVLVRRSIDQRGEERAQARGTAETARARREELGRSVELFERELRDVSAERERLTTELAQARQELERAAARFQENQHTLEGLEKRREELESRRDSEAEEEARARVEAASLDERTGAARRRLEDLAQTLAELGAELARARRLAEEARTAAASGETSAKELEKERLSTLARRGELEELLEETRQRERSGRAAIDELRRQGEGLVQRLEVLLQDVSEKRLEAQRIELARADIDRRVVEDFELAPDDLLVEFEPERELAVEGALERLAAEVASWKRQLEKLGGANLEAVDELEEVAGRLEFLRTQRNDLDEARRGLDGTLSKLNAESERRFIETFEEVRAEFKKLFRQLFGGGKADVILLEGDVLEAGIEIMARPPGRESLPISLLSGGQRTLTALAMLFAVFHTRPSPFCILDEVDAALDDANIGRFLTLLRQSTLQSQFVIVTHNKGTMAASHLLYGVTMPVRGVSRVVSVELAEVDEIVPEATGSARAALDMPGGADDGDEEADELEEASGPEALEPDLESPGASAVRGSRDESAEPEVVLVPQRPAVEVPASEAAGTGG